VEVLEDAVVERHTVVTGMAEPPRDGREPMAKDPYCRRHI
jgi:hypothetical protein